jgi:hypothetical protein
MGITMALFCWGSYHFKAALVLSCSMLSWKSSVAYIHLHGLPHVEHNSFNHTPQIDQVPGFDNETGKHAIILLAYSFDSSPYAAISRTRPSANLFRGEACVQSFGIRQVELFHLRLGGIAKIGRIYIQEPLAVSKEAVCRLCHTLSGISASSG